MKIMAEKCVNTDKFRGKFVTHFGGMCMVQNVEFRMRNRVDIVEGNIVAVIRERVRKVAGWATHGVGGRDVRLGGTSIQL
jgi:hypothetical protein